MIKIVKTIFKKIIKSICTHPTTPQNFNPIEKRLQKKSAIRTHQTEQSRNFVDQTTIFHRTHTDRRTRTQPKNGRGASATSEEEREAEGRRRPINTAGRAHPQRPKLWRAPPPETPTRHATIFRGPVRNKKKCQRRRPRNLDNSDAYRLRPDIAATRLHGKMTRIRD